MADRKKTPDILADLLDTQSQKSEISAQTPTKQRDVLPTKLSDAQTLKQQNDKMADAEEETDEKDEEKKEAKTKITFYLSHESVELLEDAQLMLRRLAKKKGYNLARSASSKSALLEIALQLACADLETNAEQSQLASKMF